MKRRILLAVFFIYCALFVYPQGLKNWAKQKEETKEATQVTEKKAEGPLYSQSVIDNKIVVNGFESFEALSDETVFVNALLWAINQNTKLKEDLPQIDYAGMRFVLKRAVSSSEPTTAYPCLLTVQIFGNRLSFLVSDIVCESNGMLGTKNIPFEKLSPEKKPKHDEYFKEFIKHNSMRLNDLFHFIRTNQLPAISHWNEITEGKVTKGMNKPECLLAYGKPLDIKVTGNKEQWMYSSFCYLFFENGVLDACVK